MPSRRRMSARVVDVLSRSTTPMGISWGCPLSRRKVKNRMVIIGKMTIQKKYMGVVAKMPHSRLATLRILVISLAFCFTARAPKGALLFDNE